MEIICEKCHNRLKIPDGKIPPGKTASVTCPGCKNKITVSGVKEENEEEALQSAQQQSAGSMGFEEEEEKYDASDKPFDFIEEEGKTALICESDGAIRDKINHVLDILEYHITVATDTRNALKKLRYHDYNLIIVNEYFETSHPDSNGILIYLKRLDMSSRRNMVVALLSSRLRTMDNLMAFSKSVNLVINTNDMDNFDKILTLGLGEHEFFYRIYNESLKKTGRI